MNIPIWVLLAIYAQQCFVNALVNPFDGWYPTLFRFLHNLGPGAQMAIHSRFPTLAPLPEQQMVAQQTDIQQTTLAVRK